MSVYTIYDKNTGKIKGIGDYPDFLAELQENEQQGLIAGEFFQIDHYVDVVTGEVKVKPILSLTTNKSLIIADGLDEWVVTGIPEGALVTDPTGVTSTVNDGEIVFSVDIPDTYVFTIKAFPHLDTEVSIEATA